MARTNSAKQWLTELRIEQQESLYNPRVKSGSAEWEAVLTPPIVPAVLLCNDTNMPTG
jgi:hypothetical protein